MPHAPFRLLRSSLVGATILGLAAGAHLMAGGTLPAPPIMAALLALHILATTIATRFKLTLPAMTALLASSQLVLHQAFDVLSHGAAMTLPAGTQMLHLSGMSAESHAAALLASATPLGTGTSAMGTPIGTAMEHLGHLGHAGPAAGWMWAAHIGASLAAAGLLAWGENTLWALADWLRPLYRRAAVVLVIPALPARPAVLPRPLPRQPWRNLRPDTRRGPPVAGAVFA